MWWALAAAAVPYVMSALQKKPKRPGAPGRVEMPDRSRYVDDSLDMAYNPNNQSWIMASDQVADQVNRVLARQGMGGSSIGAQLQAGTQAKLAETWLNEAAQRKNNALNLAMQYDRNMAGWESGQNDAQYKYAMDTYNQIRQDQAAQVQGMSNMIGAGMGAYNTSTALDQRQQMIDMAKSQRASFGVPGSYGMSTYQNGPQPGDEFMMGAYYNPNIPVTA